MLQDNGSNNQPTENKPTVLKYDMPVAANDSASSGVVTTTANGCPFPMGLPSVTMSGTTPRKMHSYDLAYSMANHMSLYAALLLYSIAAKQNRL